MAKREFIHKDNFWVDIQVQTPISIAMRRNTVTEQEIVKPYLDKIRAEIEQIEGNEFEVSDMQGNRYKYETIVKAEVLQVIDKYKAESEE